jgi:hypothetical protein
MRLRIPTIAVVASTCMIPPGVGQGASPNEGVPWEPRSAWDGRGPAPAYVAQSWPAGRRLVWAKPGKRGDLSVAANWLENSKPAETPPDRNTDIVLPASGERYVVNAPRKDVRHVLVERNAQLSGAHRGDTKVWGNVWIKDGGWMLYLSPIGDRHTFFRIDNADLPSIKNGLKFRGPKSKGGKPSRSQLSHKAQICKYGEASVEFMGNFGVSDEIMVQHGRMIINGTLYWSGATGKGALEIYDGATVELQSGARIAPFTPRNNKAIYNIDVYRNGTLQAGSPQRPLTRDAVIALGFAENDKPGRTGLYSALGSTIRVYSRDPRRARLVFTGTCAYPEHVLGSRDKQPDGVTARGKLGTAMQLAGDVILNGAHFDYVSARGIAVADHIDTKSWRYVTFGKHNAGPPKELLGKVSVDPNVYYHNRNDAQSEFAMTTAAQGAMKTYFKRADPFQLSTEPPNTDVVSANRMKRPRAKVFNGPVKVTVRCAQAGARIRYTMDGSEPGRTSPQYAGPFTIRKTSKIKAKAYKPGLGFSPTLTTVYVIQASK